VHCSGWQEKECLLKLEFQDFHPIILRHNFPEAQGNFSREKAVHLLRIKDGHTSDNGSVDGFMDVEDEPVAHGVANSIGLSPPVGNTV
ncbi:hypothetical protein HAX54_040342, partial [Datura stramonium]|nr:hypothetical protein [Datura stramonium]